MTDQFSERLDQLAEEVNQLLIKSLNGTVQLLVEMLEKAALLLEEHHPDYAQEIVASILILKSSGQLFNESVDMTTKDEVVSAITQVRELLNELPDDSSSWDIWSGQEIG